MNFSGTGSRPLTRFFGPKKNSVKGKTCYRIEDNFSAITGKWYFLKFPSQLFEPFRVNVKCKRNPKISLLTSCFLLNQVQIIITFCIKLVSSDDFFGNFLDF